MTEEIITYDPDDPDTFPSVCHNPEEVERRFGYIGGEKFTEKGIQEILDKRNNWKGETSE